MAGVSDMGIQAQTAVVAAHGRGQDIQEQTGIVVAHGGGQGHSGTGWLVVARGAGRQQAASGTGCRGSRTAEKQVKNKESEDVSWN